MKKPLKWFEKRIIRQPRFKTLGDGSAMTHLHRHRVIFSMLPKIAGNLIRMGASKNSNFAVRQGVGKNKIRRIHWVARILFFADNDKAKHHEESWIFGSARMEFNPPAGQQQRPFVQMA